jgi:hypothetical protein
MLALEEERQKKKAKEVALGTAAAAVEAVAQNPELRSWLSAGLQSLLRESGDGTNANQVDRAPQAHGSPLAAQAVTLKPEVNSWFLSNNLGDIAKAYPTRLRSFTMEVLLRRSKSDLTTVFEGDSEAAERVWQALERLRQGPTPSSFQIAPPSVATNTQELRTWLIQEANLPPDSADELVAKFAAEDLREVSDVADLSDADLEKLGISMGWRKKILRASKPSNSDPSSLFQSLDFTESLVAEGRADVSQLATWKEIDPAAVRRGERLGQGE